MFVLHLSGPKTLAIQINVTRMGGGQNNTKGPLDLLQSTEEMQLGSASKHAYIAGRIRFVA